MRVLLLAIGTLGTLLCSCTGTSVKHTWKSPDSGTLPVTKVAVLTIDERGLLRQGFENRFVAELKKRGASAITTFNLLSLSEIGADKPGAAERFRSAGADALVILRLGDTTTSYHETRPGAERYAAVTTGFETVGWYDYYTLAYTDMTATYGNLKQKVYLETSLYDLKSAKRLWLGLTQTVLTDRMDRVAEMDPIVEKVVAAMRKDGMIP